ncbi:MAG: hypothetical protein PWQ06_1443 [Anaerophaga sp.]|nr:hypothetical protein [Anaerophaga sp.]
MYFKPGVKNILITLLAFSYPFFSESQNITLSLSGSPFSENGGTATITAITDYTIASEITVDLTFTGTAIPGTDYSANNVITIASNTTTGTSVITGIDDSIYENDETIIVDISSVTNAREKWHHQQVIATITDSEDIPSITLSVNPSSIGEGQSSTITATLSNATYEDVTVNLEATNIDTQSADYNLASANITIIAGQTSATTSISAVDDGLFEGDEQVQIDISGVSGGGAVEATQQPEVITITDQQTAPTVTLSTSPTSVAENTGSSILTATLSGATDNDITIDLAVIGGTASSGDYTLPASISITAGETTGTASLSATNDDIYEGNETLTIGISTVPQGFTIGTPASATITIEDDEAPPHVSLSAQPVSISENNGTTNITATLNRRTIEPVVVNLSISNGSTENEDYQLESDAITIPAGSLSGETTLEAIDDNIYEDSESLTLSISLVSGGDAYENSTQNVTIFILDDEQHPLVTLSAAPESIVEDGTSTITTSLSNATEQTVIVLLQATNITTEDNDYNLTSTSISIPPANTTGSTTLDAIADNLYEGDEILEITISQVAGGSASIGGIQEAAITIEDAQTEPVVNLQLTGSPFTEDGGSAIISVGLNHASTREVTVELEYSGTSASNDYSGRINSVTIPSGQLEETVTLTGTDDFEAEGDETITVAILSASDATIGEQQEITATVLDDDIAGIKQIISDAGTTTSESGTSDNIAILLNTQPATDVVIEITGLDTSEGTLNSNRLTFTPENWDEPQIITVTGIDDNEVDGDISYTLAFSVVNESSDEAYHNLSVPAEVTNTDNDTSGLITNPENPSLETSESGTSDNFSLQLSSRPASTVIIRATGIDETEGTINNEEFIFTPVNWNQPQTVTVTGIDDDEADGDIQYSIDFMVDASASDQNYHNLTFTVEVTNLDNDQANRPPTPEDDEFEGRQDLVLIGSSLLDNDTDPDGHELNINTVPVLFPENGTLNINPDGTFTYTPNQAFFGTDSFGYEICDNGTPQLCSNATVTINVVEVVDHDEDGIPTEVEGYGDSDRDGTPDYLDTDSDDDDIPDAEEERGDCDQDGIPDYLDSDPCFEVFEGFSSKKPLSINWVKRYDIVSFVVFNRWGNIVYKQDKFSGEWDGTSNTGITIGKKLPSGTYYYIITVRDINKKVSGYFYIIQ